MHVPVGMQVGEPGGLLPRSKDGQALFERHETWQHHLQPAACAVRPMGYRWQNGRVARVPRTDDNPLGQGPNPLGPRPRASGVKVHLVGGGGIDCNQFLVLTEEEGLLVDAGTGLTADRTLGNVRRLAGETPVRRLYLTHWHHDHTGAAPALARALEAEVLMPEAEAVAVREGRADLTLGSMYGAEQEAYPVTGVEPGDVLEVGGERLEVLHTPGHTAGHTSLWHEGTRSLLAGDVVFSHGAFGRVDLFTGSAEAMLASLEKLVEREVRALYPGHMDPVREGAGKHVEMALSNARGMF